MKANGSTNARRAVAYLRLARIDRELGLDAQRTAIERWAAREGVAVVAWQVDKGTSGADAGYDRPVLVEALRLLRLHEAGELVVSSLDRLAMDVGIANEIERAVACLGGHVATADGPNGDDAVSKLVRSVHFAEAESERTNMRKRTKAALAAKKAKGERTGECPYGFTVATDGKTLVRDEAEQAVLREVRELRTAGTSIRGIVRALAAHGSVSRRGRAFTIASVHAMATTPDVASDEPSAAAPVPDTTTSPAPVDAVEERRISLRVAGELGTDTRTVVKVLRGQPVRGLVGARIANSIKEIRGESGKAAS